MKTLTHAEERVMLVLWKLEKGFLKEILASIPDPKPHSNTIVTILKILENKGFVTYEARGRNNLYKPRLTKEEYALKTISQLIRTYFEGSPVLLISQLLQDRKLSVSELDKAIEQLHEAGNNS